MKLKITLNRLHRGGSCAVIHNEDGTLAIVERASDIGGKETCLSAARALRAAADKFELLAQEPDRHKAATHDRINTGRKGAGK